MMRFDVEALTLMKLGILLEQLAELLSVNETSLDETSMKQMTFFFYYKTLRPNYP